MKRRAEKVDARRAPAKRRRPMQSHNDGDGYHGSIGDEIDNKQETFACPFYRRYPFRFLECMNARLVTISIVKQHLKRLHVSKSSCSACGINYPSSRDSEVDTREKICPKCGIDDSYSISPRTLDTLSRRCRRGLSLEDQWYKIWEILFGTVDASQKPFSHGVVKEITGIIRDIWSKDGNEIISSCLQARGMPISSGQLLSLVPELLDRVEERFEQKLPERNTNEQTPNTGKDVMAATLGGTDYFYLTSTNSEPPTEQGFQVPSSAPLAAPVLLAREPPMPVCSIGNYYDCQPAGVVFESQGHDWEYNSNNLSTSPEFFNATNLSEFPKYLCDPF
ncbi:hypothetical protein BFJ63_vAg17918 [Fusarium oxysporum f. sp. narcissi]|uniref:C2H2-type domain-containing protein n=1 Tax=Fusarium oxysporum f. sp. narcissi TaxID=451672 RepID=A0A4Q2V4H5_FUSOX|nr:hypothetical protein BFJ63_vAg17918 [Fusarium oxysporum f. sp. narcissi]